MSTLPSFEEFERRARAAGFDEVLERRWAPDTVVPMHTHPFAVDALVTQGEVWLTCDGHTHHVRAGQRFTLEREVPHEERYGKDGAVFWAARRH
jgi:hypothetical protein